MQSSAPRGQEFEIRIAKLLRDSGFRVEPNAGIARPRQTDIFARAEGIDLLVEVKNRKQKIDVDDIDSLRSRLRRAPPDIVGAFFTTSNPTSGAIRELESNHRCEILIFVADEIEQISSGRQNLKTLISSKRNALRTHGRVLFRTVVHTEYLNTILPSGNVEFQLGSRLRSVFESGSRFGGATYSLHIPDAGWGGVGGEGARLSLQLSLSTVGDLRDIVGYLHEKFGLSSDGMFAIQQEESCWHGVGPENFLQAVEGWPSRYAQSSSKAFHGSEVFSYFDKFRDGWLQLSSQHRVQGRSGKKPDGSFLYNSELVIQLPGIPVDHSPYLRLCEYIGDDWAHFGYIGERWTQSRRLKRSARLLITGLAINSKLNRDDFGIERGVVVGVIARNPFYGKKSLPKELLDPEIAPLHGLTETKLLLCSLRDWHDDGDVVDHYVLEGIEATEGGTGPIIRPFGTWNKILKRARDLPN
jgi:hypothetical protein